MVTREVMARQAPSVSLRESMLRDTTRRDGIPYARITRDAIETRQPAFGPDLTITQHLVKTANEE